MSQSENGLEMRRRRALYRATHRGTKEMDFLLGRFAEREIASMGEAEVAALERMIDFPDPELEYAIKQGVSLGEARLDELLGAVRRFHGLAEGN
jgi:antitoxin CptB